jgi:hypothetical protein
MTEPSVRAVAVRLELGSASSRVHVDANGSSREIALPLGTSNLFRGDPPRETEIESAIERVEEAVMPLAKLLPAGAALIAGDAMTSRVAAMAAGSNDADAVSIAAVEALFEQLAMGARRGFWAAGQAMDAPTAAAVLIVREFMHHLGFERIEAPAQAGSPTPR